MGLSRESMGWCSKGDTEGRGSSSKAEGSIREKVGSRGRWVKEGESLGY